MQHLQIDVIKFIVMKIYHFKPVLIIEQAKCE